MTWQKLLLTQTNNVRKLEKQEAGCKSLASMFGAL